MAPGSLSSDFNILPDSTIAFLVYEEMGHYGTWAECNLKYATDEERRLIKEKIVAVIDGHGILPGNLAFHEFSLSIDGKVIALTPSVITTDCVRPGDVLSADIIDLRDSLSDLGKKIRQRRLDNVPKTPDEAFKNFFGPKSK